MPEIQQRTFQVPLECDYLFERPPAPSSISVTAVTLHGYGQTPEEFLPLTRRMLGPDHAIAALRGPHPFRLKPFTTETAIGYNWGAPPHNWDRSKRLHHDILAAVLADLKALAAPKPILVAFSQPVSLNYRFVREYPDAVAGVIGLCGGVAKDWEDLKLANVQVPILHIARSEDEYYPEEKARQFESRLRSRSDSTVDFHMIPGKHRFPSQAEEIVARWVASRLE